MGTTANSQRQPKMSIASAANFLGVSNQAIHKQLRAKNLICPKVGNKSYITYPIAKKLFNFAFEPMVVVSQIVKGGVGKTTALDIISSCANTYGARVLKVDLDPQGNLSDANGVDADEHPILIDVVKGEASIEDCVVNISEGMDIISSRIENVILDNEIVNKRIPLDRMFTNLLEPIKNNYDFIFIDCPPTMGPAVSAATLYSTVVVSPLNPDKFSAKGLSILRSEINHLRANYNMDIEYKVFLNKFSGQTILSDKAIVSLISDPELEGRVLSTTIQYSQEIPNYVDENKNLFSSIKKSPVRDDFDRLTRQLLHISKDDVDSGPERNDSKKDVMETV